MLAGTAQERFFLPNQSLRLLAQTGLYYGDRSLLAVEDQQQEPLARTGRVSGQHPHSRYRGAATVFCRIALRSSISRQGQEHSCQGVFRGNGEGDFLGSKRQGESEQTAQERSSRARAAGLCRIEVHGGRRGTGLGGQQQKWPPPLFQQTHRDPDTMPRLRRRGEQAFPEVLWCAGRHGLVVPERFAVRSAMKSRIARLMSAPTFSGGWVASITRPLLRPWTSAR